FLRTQPPFDRLWRRLADGHPGGLAMGEGPAPLGAPSWPRGGGPGLPARCARRLARDPTQGRNRDISRDPGAIVLRPRVRHRALHLATLARSEVECLRYGTGALSLPACDGDDLVT